MLGAKLARRIVWPLLFAVALLFGLLAWVALRIAEHRIGEELREEADRVAATLRELPATPEHRPELYGALTRLVGVELVVDGYASRGAWTADERRRIEPGHAVLGGESFRALALDLGPRAGRGFVLFSEKRIEQRRRDVLVPVAVAGAAGLLVALGIGLAVARAIARPVRRLADSVKGFAAGRFDGDVGERGPGEIGELQDAFVRMVGAIRESERRLRESERLAALGRLAGGIAHELRNPLTAIRMAVETSTTGSERSRAEARQVALGEIQRLDRTLQELLDFVRPRKLEPRDLDLAALVDDVANLLEPQCRHLGVRVEVDAERGAGGRGDADRLKQALINLVLNGAQAQPSGGVVRLRARHGLIEVEDEGPGIPEEVRESLFQPFVTTKTAGIGLGLAVVARIVEEHGARLEFDSGPGGTKFRIRLQPVDSA